jgi:hypothetical protein
VTRGAGDLCIVAEVAVGRRSVGWGRGVEPVGGPGAEGNGGEQDQQEEGDHGGQRGTGRLQHLA